MKPKSKIQQRRDDAHEMHMAILQKWFEFSGRTMEQLIADIERLQPGEHPSDRMGIDPDIIWPVFQVPPSQMIPEWKYAITRAMQHVAIVRPWRANSPQCEFTF